MGRIRNQHGPGMQPELCGQPPAPGGHAPGGQPRALGRPRTSEFPWFPPEELEATEHQPRGLTGGRRTGGRNEQTLVKGVRQCESPTAPCTGCCVHDTGSHAGSTGRLAVGHTQVPGRGAHPLLSHYFLSRFLQTLIPQVQRERGLHSDPSSAT